MEMAARPGGEPAGREAAGLAGKLGFLEHGDLRILGKYIGCH